MANQNNRSVNPTNKISLTRAQFESEFTAFVGEMKAVVTPNDKGLRKLDGFEIRSDFIETVTAITKILEGGELEQAYRTLESVRRHFIGKQRAYARDFMPTRLQRELGDMIQTDYHPDLLSRVRASIEVYEQYTQQSGFDLDRASGLYWDTAALISSVDEEFKQRETSRLQQEKRRKDELEQERIREITNRETNRRETDQKLNAESAGKPRGLLSDLLVTA